MTITQEYKRYLALHGERSLSYRGYYKRRLHMSFEEAIGMSRLPNGRPTGEAGDFWRNYLGTKCKYRTFLSRVETAKSRGLFISYHNYIGPKSIKTAYTSPTETCISEPKR